MYCIYEILYYNNVTQCYINILILDRAPNSNEPLNQITHRIHFPKLSPFDVYSKCNVYVFQYGRRVGAMSKSQGQHCTTSYPPDTPPS